MRRPSRAEKFLKSYTKSKFGEADENNYHPDRFPPDLEFARNHAKANRVAHQKKISQDKFVELCDCCGLPIDNILYPLSINTSELIFLGPGYPLFFQYFKMCLFMLLLPSIASIYLLQENAKGNFCSATITKDNNQDCEVSFINSISLVNQANSRDTQYVQSWILFIIVIIMNLSINFFRIIERKMEKECDEGLLSPSDFTIVLSNLPSGYFNVGDLEKNLTRFCKNISLYYKQNRIKGPENDNMEIAKINIGYNIINYIKLENKKKKYILRKRKALSFYSRNGYYPKNFSLAEIDHKLKGFENMINDARKMMREGVTKNFSSFAFITFSKSSDVRFILKVITTSGWAKIFRRIQNCFGDHDDELYMVFAGRKLNIERAPEPDTILWENLGFSESVKRNHRIITNIANLFVFIVCFIIIYLVSMAKTSLRENQSKNYTNTVLIYISNILASFSVVSINSILVVAVKKLVNLEKHFSVTNYKINMAKRLTIAQFLNTVLVPLIASILFTDKPIWASELVPTVFYIISVNSIILPILVILDPFYLIKLWKRNKLIKEGHASLVTQKEANAIFENPKMDLAMKYSSILKSLFFSVFYVSLVPIVVIISFASCIILFLIEKYLLLRRYSRGILIGVNLNQEMIEYLEYAPLTLSVGNLIFQNFCKPSNYELTLSDRLPDILAIILSFLNLALPMREIVNLILPEDQKDGRNESIYQQSQFNFVTDYDRANPVTQEAAIAKFVEILEKKGDIAQKEKLFQSKAFKNAKILLKFTTKNKLTRTIGTIESEIENYTDTVNFEDYIEINWSNKGNKQDKIIYKLILFFVFLYVIYVSYVMITNS